jgi:AraC-like DNA-binding protein
MPWPIATEIDWTSITKHLATKGYFSLKVRSGLFPASFHYIFRPLLVLSYLTLAWLKLLRSRTAESKNHDQTQHFWILFFLRTATFFQTLSLIPAFLTAFHVSYTLSSFIIVNCLALLAIILYTLHKPSIFYGHLLVAVDWKKKPELPPFTTEESQEELKPSYAEKNANEKPLNKASKKVKIPANQLAEYSFSMKKLMEEAELYLLHDFQIIDLAAKLDIPVHHCSYIINNHIGKNFRDWINGYRVNYFLKQYPIKGDKITIEAIANESGFKSLATFYNAFKKEKGAMPSHYLNQEESRKLLNKEMSD